MPNYEQRKWLRVPEQLIKNCEIFMYPSGLRSIFIVGGFRFTLSQLELLFEHKVLGKSQRQIARETEIGFQTIQNNMQRLKQYNNMLDLDEAAEKAQSLGLLDLDVVQLLWSITQIPSYKHFPIMPTNLIQQN